MMDKRIMAIDRDGKTPLGRKYGYVTGIMFLAPEKLSGVNVCKYSTPGCRSDCLFYQGRARVWGRINMARIERTRLLFQNPPLFNSLLRWNIRRVIKYAARDGLKPAIRINGTSDLQLHKVFPGLFEEFPDVQFYDYTKDIPKMRAYLRGEFPDNYYLTYSLSELPSSERFALEVLKAGANVAAVFRTKDRPRTFLGFKTCDGDLSDLRFLDPRGRVVALKAKGTAKRNSSGFVHEVTQ